MKRLIILAACLFGLAAANEAETAIAPAQAETIQVAEYFFNSDPGQGQGRTVMIESSEWPLTLAIEIPVEVIAALPPGTHTLGCRVLDQNGVWSHTFSRPVYRGEIEETAEPRIQAVEYFIGPDPGQGKGLMTALETAVNPVSVAVRAPSELIAALPTGTHMLAARVQDQNGDWSTAFTRPFYKAEVEEPNSALISQIEYQWHELDGTPLGGPVAVPAVPPAIEVTFNPLAEVGTLEETKRYLLHVIPFDTLGRRGEGHSRAVAIDPNVKLASIEVGSGDTLKFLVTGASELDLKLQFSVDLKDWTDVHALTATSDSLEFTVMMESAPHRFFRILME